MPFSSKEAALLLAQLQESQALAGSDFLNIRREFFSYFQPIRLLRLYSENAQRDGKSVIRRLPVLDAPRRSRFLVLTEGSAASGDENDFVFALVSLNCRLKLLEYFSPSHLLKMKRILLSSSCFSCLFNASTRLYCTLSSSQSRKILS